MHASVFIQIVNAISLINLAILVVFADEIFSCFFENKNFICFVLP